MPWFTRHIPDILVISFVALLRANAIHYLGHSCRKPHPTNSQCMHAFLQGSAKRWSSGWVNFVAAVAYHFCLTLPEAFTQPGAHLFAGPCTVLIGCVIVTVTVHGTVTNPIILRLSFFGWSRRPKSFRALHG